MQYIINLTGIWLLSLMVFDIFLKKESYHTYNRLYLLTTMLAGIIFPLIKWQPDTARLYTAMQQPVSNVIAVKGNIVAATESTAQVSWDKWLLVIYMIGAVMMVYLLLKDIIQLIGYYRAGRKSDITGWTLVETGKGHAPFSFFNLLFVSDRADYSAEEWRMLAQHEGRHTRLLHIIDLTLLQVCRVIFWFHPLAYLYNKRLLMVHEYQADNVALDYPQVYGKFLVEQSVLHAAPSITHSFNRSPIKNRILMLTKRSTIIARTKMVMVLPLTMACLVLFSHISFSQRFDRKGNKVTYRGNTFELGNAEVDTIIIIDPVTGGEITRLVQRQPMPQKINGRRIYKPGELTAQPKVFSQNGTIQDYVFRKISEMLNELPDGTYDLDINNLVVDKNGKIVYYEGEGIRQYSDKVSPEAKEAIADKIDEVIYRAPAMKPGEANGNNVVSLSYTTFSNFEIEVKAHQATLKETFK